MQLIKEMTTSYFCAVKDCKNGSRKLEKWKFINCIIHDGIIHKNCSCDPPFKLYPFPTAKKDPVRRDKWIRLINRVDAKGKPWTPNAHSRVCSGHFVDGEPSLINPLPTKNLGYNASSRIKNLSDHSSRRSITYSSEDSFSEKSHLSSSVVAPIVFCGEGNPILSIQQTPSTKAKNYSSTNMVTPQHSKSNNQL